MDEHFGAILPLTGCLGNCSVSWKFWTDCFKTLTICLVCINEGKHILFCSACSELSQLYNYLLRWSHSLILTEREIGNVDKINPGWKLGSSAISKREKRPRLRTFFSMGYFSLQTVLWHSDSYSKEIRNAWITFFWPSLEERYYERVELHPVGNAEILAFHTAQTLNESAWSDFWNETSLGFVSKL